MEYRFNFMMILSNSYAHSKKPARVIQPAFRGVEATKAARASLLKDIALKTALVEEKDPYVGEVPSEMMKSKTLSEKQVLQKLDELASKIGADCYRHKTGDRRGWWSPITVFKEKIWEKFYAWRKTRKEEFQLKYIGGGSFGRVYKISLPLQQEYAFKVFRPAEQVINYVESVLAKTLYILPQAKIKLENKALRMPYREVANSFFFNERNTCDLKKMFVANPSKMWSLSELIPDRPIVKRPGQSIRELGYMFEDDCARNRIHGMLIEAGGKFTRLSALHDWKKLQKFLNAGKPQSKKSEVESKSESKPESRVESKPDLNQK
jgi:hypothetical protein